MSEPTFTPDYFRLQVAELWRRMGEKSFWLRPETSQAAVKALGHVYLHMQPEPGERERQWFEVALDELTRREGLLARALR